MIVRAASRLCGLPIASVIEVMRPLPIRPLDGAPAAVLGLAIVRGAATVVVDLGRLLGPAGGTVGRFVSLRVGARTVALAVADVIGVQTVATGPLPAVVAELPAVDALGALGARDAELLLVLGAARLLPDDVLALAEPAAP